MQKQSFPGIVGPSYTYGSLPIDCQLSINFEPIAIESQSAKTRFALIGTPGCQHITFSYLGVQYDHIPTAFPGKIRGMYYTTKGFLTQAAGALIVVASESVYEVKPPDINGVHVLRKIGVVSNLNGNVSMVDDGVAIIISDNLTLYRIKLSDYTMTSLGTESPLQATSVTYLNGYTICAGNRDGVPSNSFFFSKPYKNDQWDALNFASAEGVADPLTTVKTVGGDVWLFGPRSYEVWQTTGNFKKPFTRVSGSMGSIGSAAPEAVSVIGDTVFFLGSGATGNTRAYMSKGYAVTPISTDALEQQWANFASFGDATGFAYSMEGRTYWVITWINDNITYVYNAETGSWHQRASRNATLDVFNRWLISQGAYAYDSIYVGDLEGTKLYSLSSAFCDEDGNPIVRVRRSPHIHNGMGMLMHRSIAVDVETGMGLATGQGSNPQIMMRYSSDGGRTWSSELWITAGRQGEYRTRCKWSRLGVARDRVYELYCSDPVRWMIAGAELELDQSSAGI
jgi:hypothetical protein